MRTRDLLSRLELGDLYESQLLTKEETGFEVDILTTLMTEFGGVSNIGQGEYYFYGDEEPEGFACRITVVAEVLPENVAPMCTELAVTNAELPMGCFAYDPELNTVVYILQTPLAEGLSDEDIISEANTCIRLALRLSEGYAAQYAYYAGRREL
ncbi:MAG: hypothetical protein IKN79_08585 [Eubacterium sp.]|nr:hypothetical protein [Eubacterium sp.]